MKPAQQPQQANTNPADKSEPSAVAATAAVMYGKMEALMQANMQVHNANMVEWHHLQ